MAKKEISSSKKKSKLSPQKKQVKKAAKKTAKEENVHFREDTHQTNILIRAGYAASANAIKESKALGLSITYMKNGILYREKTDGTTEVLTTTKNTVKRKIGSIALKKGLVLHAKK